MKADFMFSDFQGWKILTLQKKTHLHTFLINVFSIMSNLLWKSSLYQNN